MSCTWQFDGCTCFFLAGSGPTRGPHSGSRFATSRANANAKNDREQSTALLELLTQGTIDKLDFYPRDRILLVQSEGHDPLEFFVNEGVLAKVCETVHSRSLNHRFKSHFNQSFISSAGDDNWDFLQKSLEPCLGHMQQKFRESYLERLDTTGLVASASPGQLESDCRRQTAEALLVEAMSAIEGSLKSAVALKMVERYRTRIHPLLRRCIEDALLAIGCEIDSEAE